MINAKAEMKFSFQCAKDAEVIYKAIKPELYSGPSDRAEVTLNLQEKKIKMTIQAKDSASLRAAVNTYSRWMKLSKTLMEV